MLDPYCDNMFMHACLKKQLIVVNGWAEQSCKLFLILTASASSVLPCALCLVLWVCVSVYLLCLNCDLFCSWSTYSCKTSGSFVFDQEKILSVPYRLPQAPCNSWYQQQLFQWWQSPSMASYQIPFSLEDLIVFHTLFLLVMVLQSLRFFILLIPCALEWQLKAPWALR